MGQTHSLIEVDIRQGESQIQPSLNTRLSGEKKNRYSSSPGTSPRTFSCTADTKIDAVNALLQTIQLVIDDTATIVYTLNNIHEILFCIQQEKYFPVKLHQTAQGNQYQANIKIY
jgi:hypothetical protein